jgi:hypothetical protein
MRRRSRKFVGAVAMLAFVFIYALAVVSLAQGRLQDAGRVAQAIFYLVAGVGWILPLMPLIRWMERPDDESA